MAYLIISTAIEQYGFFWKLTLANFVKVNCQLVGISANARKQETILKFMLPNGQRFSINILEILIIEKGILFRLAYPIGSPQNVFRLQLLQNAPIQTSSNWVAAFLTNPLLLLKTPASKLRVFSPFMPSPAPVKFAEPT